MKFTAGFIVTFTERERNLWIVWLRHAAFEDLSFDIEREEFLEKGMRITYKTSFGLVTLSYVFTLHARRVSNTRTTFTNRVACSIRDSNWRHVSDYYIWTWSIMLYRFLYISIFNLSILYISFSLNFIGIVSFNWVFSLSRLYCYYVWFWILELKLNWIFRLVGEKEVKGSELSNGVLEPSVLRKLNLQWNNC